MPFFYTSCDKSKSSEIEEVVMEMDTTSKFEDSNSDGVEINKFLSPAKDSTKTSSNASLLEDDSLFNRLPFLRPMLNPKENNYSGLGIMITHISITVATCVFICFLLLLISLIIKCIDANAKKAIVLIDVFALIALLVARPFASYYERLWGFWVCITFIFLLTVYDIYIARLYYQQGKNGNS
ncbi:MAG: hypothetical protein JNM96_05135 [Bacteroidia bacterium]|nr:hypothetical protein [Bacteroidia bacterium]